jgi:hypothetical protein
VVVLGRLRRYHRFRTHANQVGVEQHGLVVLA